MTHNRLPKEIKRMSALGQKQTFRGAGSDVRFGSKADMCSAQADVR